MNDKGGGKTPPMVVELLNKAVAEKSQSAVARETGLTLLTVQRYLKGIGEPRQKNLERLADYFEVSVPFLRGDVLFTEEDIKSDPLLNTSFYEAYKKSNVYDKYAMSVTIEFASIIAVFNDPDNDSKDDLDFIKWARDRAEKVLKTQETFYNKIDKEIWEQAKQQAKEVILCCMKIISSKTPKSNEESAVREKYDDTIDNIYIQILEATSLSNKSEGLRKAADLANELLKALKQYELEINKLRKTERKATKQVKKHSEQSPAPPAPDSTQTNEEEPAKKRDNKKKPQVSSIIINDSNGKGTASSVARDKTPGKKRDSGSDPHSGRTTNTTGETKAAKPAKKRNRRQ